MATLTTLQNFIDNIKQTPSGKVEWSDVSLKGLEEEVLNLFSTNAVQTAANVVNLQTLSGVDSQLVVVENDPTLAKNGIYFWSSSPVVIGYTYPAANGGYWNLVRNPTTSPVTKITAGTNVTISPTGGTGDVTINSQSTAINATNYFVPTRLNSTTFTNSNIYDNISTTQTATAGFRFNYGSAEYTFGDYSNGNNGTVLLIDDAAETIQTKYGGNSLGLTLSMANRRFTLGDTGSNNGAKLFIDDVASTVLLSTSTSNATRLRMSDSGSAIQLTCSNLELNASASLTINGTTTTTSYTSIPRFLEVEVNGVTCYIPLYQ